MERMHNMAKSNLVKVNKEIARHLTTGLQKIQETVVDGYTTVEDAFVEQYLTKENETISEAKIRLKQEQKNRYEVAEK